MHKCIECMRAIATQFPEPSEGKSRNQSRATLEGVSGDPCDCDEVRRTSCASSALRRYQHSPCCKMLQNVENLRWRGHHALDDTELDGDGKSKPCRSLLCDMSHPCGSATTSGPAKLAASWGRQREVQQVPSDMSGLGGSSFL